MLCVRVSHILKPGSIYYSKLFFSRLIVDRLNLIFPLKITEVLESMNLLCFMYYQLLLYCLVSILDSLSPNI